MRVQTKCFSFLLLFITLATVSKAASNNKSDLPDIIYFSKNKTIFFDPLTPAGPALGEAALDSSARHFIPPMEVCRQCSKMNS